MNSHELHPSFSTFDVVGLIENLRMIFLLQLYPGPLFLLQVLPKCILVGGPRTWSPLFRTMT